MAVRLQFEGIRCFVKPQSAVIRPLTLLVGENSSGKSTFLALCQAASSVVGFRGVLVVLPQLNKAPFSLGAYDQIASYGERSGSAKRFWIALGVEGSRQVSARVEFIPRDGQPFLRRLQVVAGNQRWQAGFVRQGKTPKFRGPGPRQAGGMLETLSTISSELGRTYAFAPIRTNPRRTYDPISVEPEPEGSHVPMLLARLSRAGANGQWTGLASALNKFGSQAGLFDRIEVIRKGKSESDPFQIGVKTGGPTFNLIDVGYGVSQSLPILVETVLQSENVTFLLQQPEVHLHPRAQAELGSFFAQQVGRKHRFVIETHSDHLIDRVRMEVRRGTLKPEQVSLLYFERQKQGATIHNLELGPDGSIIDPPAGYRQFFMDEERRLLDI
jgi:hypothetical protein